MMRLLPAALVIALPATAFAYIGPGAGITAIGTVLALLGAIVLAIIGFVWYPIKHLVKRFRNRSRNVAPARAGQGSDAQ